MKRVLWDDRRGFTTAELLVAALFGMIVMATLYGFYREQLFNLLQQETKTATLEDARGALDMMARELRNAGSWGKSPYTAPLGCSRVATATATSIRIQSDLNGDGDCKNGVPETDTDEAGEDVTYTYDSSSGNITRSSSSSPLVSNVVLASGISFLTYYNASGTVLTPPISDLTTVKRVRIAFGVQVQNPNPGSRSAVPNVSSILSTSVEFRN